MTACEVESLWQERASQKKAAQLEMENLRAELSALQNQLTDKDGDYSQMRSSIQAENQDLTGKLKQAEAEIMRLQSELDAGKSEVTKFREAALEEQTRNETS